MMMKVYMGFIKTSDGGALDIHPILAERKIDESQNGRVGYFAVDEVSEKEFGKSLSQSYILSAEEAKSYDADDLSETAGGNFAVDAWVIE